MDRAPKNPFSQAQPTDRASGTLSRRGIRPRALLLGTIAVCLGIPGSLPAPSGEDAPHPAREGEVAAESSPGSILVDRCQTRVGIARVYLSVPRLDLDRSELRGIYHLEVPLMQSKSETGDIVLHTGELPSEVLLRKGGRLSGKGYSRKPNMPARQIEARVIPFPDRSGQGLLQLTIDTGGRILRFETTYQMATPVSGTLHRPAI